MLQRQWKYELRRKFNLDFEVIDSDSTFQLRRRLGIDTNPWKAFPRIITSMDYLRMPDVLEQFLQASGAGADAEANGDRPLPHAPWDLLIVDECHHFAPQSGSRASQRTRMLREIRFLFEHRLFASATPHNGKTVCFTGLLELLDPIRFQMTTEMDAKDKSHLGEVRIRRLKDDINQQSIRPPFAEQLPPVELKLDLSPQEIRPLRRPAGVPQEGTSRPGARLGGGTLAGPVHLLAADQTAAVLPVCLRPDVVAAPGGRGRTGRRPASSTWPGSRRNGPRNRPRATTSGRCWRRTPPATSGAYFRSRGQTTEDLQRQVNQALEALGYDRKTVEDPGKLAALAKKSDSKTEALVRWVKQHLFAGGKLRDDERLIVFTEYKETLFYLEQRLLQEGSTRTRCGCSTAA